MVDFEEVEDTPIHVMPEFGPQHQCSAYCWCHPECINVFEFVKGFHDKLIWTHHVAH